MALTVEKDKGELIKLLVKKSLIYISMGLKDYPLIFSNVIKNKEEELRGLFDEYNAGKYKNGSDAFKSLHYEMVWITDPMEKRKINKGAYQFLKNSLPDILAEYESLGAATSVSD